MTRKLGFALAATVLALAGCGGGGDGRPSVDEISKVLTEGGEVQGEQFSLPGDQADCVAEALHSSEMTDEALNALVEKDDDFEPSNADEEAMTGIQEDVVGCITPES